MANEPVGDATAPDKVTTSTAAADDFERRNTDPTIPIDGADPQNIAGPFSNVELKISADKHYPYNDESEATRLRPAQARQKAKTGQVISDSDAQVNPDLAGQVGEDHGEQARRESNPEGRTSTPPSKATAGSRGAKQQTA